MRVYSRTIKSCAAVLLGLGLLSIASPAQAKGRSVRVTTHLDKSAQVNKATNWANPKRYKHAIPVQFLGINDLHGGIDRTGTLHIGATQYAKAGGASRLSSYLNKAQNYFKSENKKGYTWRLESGDMVGASPSNSALLQDEPTMHALKAMHFTIGTLGNHEFDEGLSEFNRIVLGKKPTKKYNSAEMAYPHQKSGLNIVVANVVKKSNGKIPFGWKPYTIRTVKQGKKRVKVAFIGILTTTMPSLTTYKNYSPYKYLDEARTIAKYDRILRKKGVKAIVVMAHTGVGTYQETATSKATTSGPTIDILKKLYKIDPKNSVDFYLAGHSHQYANAQVGNTRVVQAAYSGEAFDDIVGYISPKTHDFIKSSIRAHVFPVMSEDQDKSVKADSKITKIIQDADKRTQKIVNQKIGEAAEARSFSDRTQNNQFQENETGDFVVDAQLAIARQENKDHVDFAMTNGGGVRAGLKVNSDRSITWGAAQDVQPFGNTLDLVAMTGQQIYDVLNQQYINQKTYLLVAGLKYDFTKSTKPNQKYEVTKVYDENGKELDKNKVYHVVINEFLKGNGDNFPQFKAAKLLGTATSETDTEVLVRYISEQTKAGNLIKAPKLNRKNYVG